MAIPPPPRPGTEDPLPPDHSLPSYSEPTPETHRQMSREEEADLSLRSTTFSPGARGLTIFLFLATISTALLWQPIASGSRRLPAFGALARLLPPRAKLKSADSLPAIWHLLPHPEELKTAEKNIERESALSQWLLPRVQLPLTGWLGAGNEQAYPGRNGWLFYRPDVEYLTGAPFLDPEYLRRRSREQHVDADPVQGIVDFYHQLQARGIRLIVLPAPVKPSVEGAQLSSRLAAAERLQNPSFGEWKARLTAAGVEVFDPLPLLPANPNGAPLYLHTDTHWRPETMEAMARQLRPLLPASGPPVAYRRTEKAVSALGDIATMLKLPSDQRLYPRENVTIHPIESGNGLWRPVRSAEILLLGDSFSNIYALEGLGWGEAAGLAEQLSAELQRPLDSILRNSDGSFATREMLSRELARGSDRLAGKKVVIWEFAARELAFGNWKRLPMTVGQVQPTRFFTPPAGRETVVTGTVQAVSLVPRPGTVPYRDHLVTVQLVDLSGPDLRREPPQQALVCLASMWENAWTPAARLRPGDRITVRVRPWSEVSAQYEKINRSELDDSALQLEEPSWAELAPAP